MLMRRRLRGSMVMLWLGYSGLPLTLADISSSKEAGLNSRVRKRAAVMIENEPMIFAESLSEIFNESDVKMWATNWQR